MAWEIGKGARSRAYFSEQKMIQQRLIQKNDTQIEHQLKIRCCMPVWSMVNSACVQVARSRYYGVLYFYLFSIKQQFAYA